MDETLFKGEGGEGGGEMVTAVEQAGGTDEERAHTQEASTRPSLTACGSTLPNLDPALLSAVANKVPLPF
jgi:hypothetical protein